MGFGFVEWQTPLYFLFVFWREGRNYRKIIFISKRFLSFGLGYIRGIHGTVLVPLSQNLSASRRAAYTDDPILWPTRAFETVRFR